MTGAWLALVAGATTPQTTFWGTGPADGAAEVPTDARFVTGFTYARFDEARLVLHSEVDGRQVLPFESIDDMGIHSVLVAWPELSPATAYTWVIEGSRWSDTFEPERAGRFETGDSPALPPSTPVFTMDEPRRHQGARGWWDVPIRLDGAFTAGALVRLTHESPDGLYDSYFIADAVPFEAEELAAHEPGAPLCLRAQYIDLAGQESPPDEACADVRACGCGHSPSTPLGSAFALGAITLVRRRRQLSSLAGLELTPPTAARSATLSA